MIYDFLKHLRKNLILLIQVIQRVYASEGLTLAKPVIKLILRNLFSLLDIRVFIYNFGCLRLFDKFFQYIFYNPFLMFSHPVDEGILPFFQLPPNSFFKYGV
jgi:hypothetical protein